ncbi:MAG TPA: efflux RND transporter permease subunit [Candidatus Acidoferrales bacterium]|jgi:HAE1 family hydrophobic/amphiphilic exporter-1|nr:efflux RND transporter permease subunit [Candidatus Acidoferrales bacterium]
MNIAAPFIRRPIMTTLVMAAILLFGIIGYRALAVSDLPNVDYPTLQVSATLPGANPDTMASAVATPLEKQFSTIAGIDSMTSTSTLGKSQITLQFDLDRKLDGAAQDVQAAIARAAPQLPPNMPTPPTYNKVNPADQPILFLVVSSPTLPLYTVDQYAETLLAQRISMVKGVAQVMIYGSRKYAVRIELDPQALASRQIGIDEVTAAVQDANVNLPTGTLYGEHRAFTLQANGQLTHASEYRPLIVAYRNGSPVRLEELGKVLDSVQDDKVANNDNGVPAIVLAVQRQPGTNTVEVVDSIKKILPQFHAILPPSVSLNIAYDRSQSIRASVDDVKSTLFLAIALVVLVIFLFLRNLSATVIPSIALPMSIVGTFAVMYELNYTVDNLSLMALTLSVGFVVDDAIVMLENIVRHMEMGETVRNAALLGAREIGFTIVSMTLSLAAVFIPVLFLGGIIGRLLHEFSVVIMAAILVSGFVSLTLTPMLCSRFLRPIREQKHGRLYMALERFFDRLLKRYDVSLQWSLRHRVFVMAISFVILAITVWQFYVMPKGFLPEEDASQIFAYTEAAQGISFDSMVQHQRELAQVLLNDPNRQEFFSSISGGGNSGFIWMHIKDPGERPAIPSQSMLALQKKYGDVPVFGEIIRWLTPHFAHHPNVNEVIAELRPKFARIPGIRIFMQNPPPIQIGGQMSKSQYQFTLQSPDTEDLYRTSVDFQEKMSKLPGLIDVTSDLLVTNPQVNVNVNRDKASALGVTAAQVENALYTAYGQRQVSTIYAPNDEFWVVMELEDKYQRDPTALSLLYIRSSTGALVPLNAVANLATSVGPLSVNHLGQLPAVTISFNLRPGTAIGDAVNQINRLAADLPQSISTQFQGAAQAFQSSLTGLGVLLLLAILVIYIVLGILYESFIHPLTILSGLPSAAFGALLTLQIFGYSLDLYSFVGIIMLIGIVKKNAIMMVDFAVEREKEGDKSAQEAVYEGCLIRFRPIMMTTMAALMGTLPIAIGTGAGADSRRPLGLVVVGGLLFSQLVTLYLTPVFYTYMDSFQKWLGRHLGKAAGHDKPELALPVSAD